MISILDFFGDELFVERYNGLWYAPCDGTKHVSARDAMCVELKHFILTRKEIQ